MTLVTHIYETPDKNSLLYTLQHGFSFSSGERGFLSWQATLDVGPDEAQAIYNWPYVPHVEVVDGATSVVWEGRLEDIALEGERVALGAYGYWRALKDVPYTALWSVAGSGEWREVTEEDNAAYTPSKFNLDNNNRLYISLKKNQDYGAGNAIGALTLAVPHNSDRTLIEISYSYDVTLPNSDWEFRVYAGTDAFGSLVEDRAIAGNGGSQTGTETITLTTGKERLVVEARNTSGTYSNTDEDDTWYVKLTNVRVATQAPGILASDIAAALAVYVNGVNSGQLQDSAALIEATTPDLDNELYEDELPADILDRLAFLHNYETGVYEDRLLYFRERASAGLTWYVNARGILEAQRSLERIANSAYATYKGEGRTLRTAVADDDFSQSRLGLVRRDYVKAGTTSQTEAETHRDAMLSDRADDYPRISIEIERLEDAAGGVWPLYHVRAGDTVVFRDLLPYALSPEGGLATFVVGETEYDADEPNRVSLLSREPVPTLAVLVAREKAGLR